MSLQVFSPHSHTHSNDPQSPYPCTPSTMSSSPPAIHSSSATTSSSSNSNNQNNHQQQYFRTSHYSSSLFLRESSPTSQFGEQTPDMTFQPHRHHEEQHSSRRFIQPQRTQEQLRDGGGDESTEGERTIIKDNDEGDSSMDLDGQCSINSSPEMPLSVKSPSMSTLSGSTPERGSPFQAYNNRTRHGGGSPFASATTSSSGMKTHPSAASIPIIFAGRGAVNALNRTRENERAMQASTERISKHGKEYSEDSLVSSESDAVLQSTQVKEEEQRASVGLGLGILQEPINLAETKRYSNSIQAISPFSPIDCDFASSHRYSDQSSSQLNNPNNMELTAPRQDRADSWTSSLVSMGMTSSSSSHSSARPSTPDGSPPSSAGMYNPPTVSRPGHPNKLLPAHDGYAGGVGLYSNTRGAPYQEKNVIHSAPVNMNIRSILEEQDTEGAESPSQASEFSISAYDHSPMLGQDVEEQEGVKGHHWRTATGDSRSGLLPGTAPETSLLDCTHEQEEKSDVKQMDEQKTVTVPKPVKKKKSKAIAKAETSTNAANHTPTDLSLGVTPKKDVKKRRRAVTLANPPDAGSDLRTRKSLRRQSSPPTIFPPTFTSSIDDVPAGISLSASVPSSPVRKRPSPIDERGPSGTPTSVDPRKVSMTAHVRPATAGAATEGMQISPLTFFKPLPALPSVLSTPRSRVPSTSTSQSQVRPQTVLHVQSHGEASPRVNRPGYLSVQTSPRKAAFSRPATASPAARSFGLVAPYSDRSPSHSHFTGYGMPGLSSLGVTGSSSSKNQRDYRSLRSRDSFLSLLERKARESRSRSASVSSQFSSNVGANAATANQSTSSSTAASANGILPPPPRFITFFMDQESFREVAPVFQHVETVEDATSSSHSGLLYRYVPIYLDQAYPFHHSAMEAPPVLRRLQIEGKRISTSTTSSFSKTTTIHASANGSINEAEGSEYDKRDYMAKQSTLPIKNEGIYAVNGTSAKGEHRWRFEYRVKDRLNLVGRPIPGEKNLTPMSFTCAPEVLDPANARKKKAMDVVYKTLASKLEALRVGDLPPDST